MSVFILNSIIHHGLHFFLLILLLKTLFQLNFLEADVAQSLLLLVEHIIISYFSGHRSRDPGYQTQKNVNPFAPERFKMQKNNDVFF